MDLLLELTPRDLPSGDQRRTYKITSKGRSVLAYLDLPSTLSTVRIHPSGPLLAVSDLLYNTDLIQGLFVYVVPLRDCIRSTQIKPPYTAFNQAAWNDLPSFTDYAHLPSVKDEVRILDNHYCVAFGPGHSWTATSNPWFDSDGVALLRIFPTPALRLSHPAAYTATVDLATWLTSPLIPNSQPGPSPAPFRGELSPIIPTIPPQPFASVNYDQIFLRLLAASITGVAITDESSIYSRGDGLTDPAQIADRKLRRDTQLKYHIEVAADLAEAALIHLASRKDSSCPPQTPTPNPKSPPTS